MIYENPPEEILGILNYLKNQNIPLQKIVIQKISFFMKIFGFVLAYSFEPYKYGPFSEKLSEDLETLDVDKKIKINKTNVELIDSSISDNLNGNAKTFIDLFDDMVAKNYDFDNMEIYGTVLYCIRSLYESSDPVTKETVLEQFIGWKGNRYSEARIYDSFEKIMNFENNWNKKIAKMQNLAILNN